MGGGFLVVARRVGVLALAAFAVSGYAVPAALPVGGGLVSDSWLVEVSVSYPGKGSMVSGVPVLSLSVPVGQCVTGDSRVVPLLSRVERVTQKLCVTQVGDRATIHGWVFAGGDFPAAALKSDFSALQLGQPFSVETDGRFVRSVAGLYTIAASRRSVLPVQDVSSPGRL